MAGWGTGGFIKPGGGIANTILTKNIKQLSGAMGSTGATIGPDGGLLYPGTNPIYREGTPNPTPPVVTPVTDASATPPNNIGLPNQPPPESAKTLGETDKTYPPNSITLPNVNPRGPSTPFTDGYMPGIVDTTAAPATAGGTTTPPVVPVVGDPTLGGTAGGGTPTTVIPRTGTPSGTVGTTPSQRTPGTVGAIPTTAPGAINPTLDPGLRQPYYDAQGRLFYASGTAGQNVSLPPGATGVQASRSPNGPNGNPAAVQPTGQAGGWLPQGWTPAQAPPGSVVAIGLSHGIDPRQYSRHDDFVDAVNQATGVNGVWSSHP